MSQNQYNLNNFFSENQIDEIIKNGSPSVKSYICQEILNISERKAMSKGLLKNNFQQQKSRVFNKKIRNFHKNEKPLNQDQQIKLIIDIFQMVELRQIYPRNKRIKILTDLLKEIIKIENEQARRYSLWAWYYGLALYNFTNIKIPKKNLRRDIQENLISSQNQDGSWSCRYIRIDPSQKAPKHSCYLTTANICLGLAQLFSKKSSMIKSGVEFLLDRMLEDENKCCHPELKYWKNLDYPQPYIDVLKILNIAGKFGYNISDSRIKRGINRLIESQNNNGFWERKNQRNIIVNDYWITAVAIKTIKSLY